MRLLIPATLGLLCASAPLHAQIANDECTGAVVVVDGFNGPFSNVGATDSTPAFTCGAGGSDIWFVYTASCTGTLTADTCTGTSYDTAMRIFDATCQTCGSFVSSAACNDDACGLQSSVTIPCVQGSTYFISVGGFAGGQGTFGLTVGCTPGGGGGPADDECSAPNVLALGVNGPFSNVGYTTSTPGWACAAGGNDIWFSYTATCTAPHSFYTCSPNTTFDTAIEAFSGTCGCGLVQLGCNDDYCGLQSKLTVPLSLGQTVLVRVGGFAGYTGSFDLTVEVGTHNGAVNTYPDACGGLGLTTTGNPNINGAITSTLSGAVGLSGLGYGFLRSGVNVCGTCTIGHDFSVVLIGTSFPLVLPCDPALIGGSLFTQGFDLTAPGGCPGFDITLSNTDEIVIG